MLYPIIVVIVLLLVLFVRLVLIFIRDLFTNPLSALLLLVATAGFYVAAAGILALVAHYFGTYRITPEALPYAWGMLVAGVLVGNAGYWGRMRWNDHLEARRLARMTRTVDRLAAR